MAAKKKIKGVPAPIEDNTEEREMILATLKERYEGITERDLAFLCEYVLTGNKYKSFMKVHPISKGGHEVTANTAGYMASTILKKYDFRIEEFLDLAGHDFFSMKEALDSLKKDSPKDYLTHMIKLKKLDEKIVNVNVKELPVLQIVDSDVTE